MQYFHLNKHRYIICLKKRYSWIHFKKRVKVIPGSYSETFAKKIYASAFDNVYNIVEEYSKYYKKEYETIASFMFWRYGVSDEICKQILLEQSGYMAIFQDEWYLEDNELFKEVFEKVFAEVDN